jgi:hypothetical protein
MRAGISTRECRGVHFGERGSRRSDNSELHMDASETLDVYILGQEVGEQEMRAGGCIRQWRYVHFGAGGWSTAEECTCMSQKCISKQEVGAQWRSEYGCKGECTCAPFGEGGRSTVKEGRCTPFSSVF